MPRFYHVQLTTGPIELYAVTQAAGGGVVMLRPPGHRASSSRRPCRFRRACRLWA